MKKNENPCITASSRWEVMKLSVTKHQLHWSEARCGSRNERRLRSTAGIASTAVLCSIRANVPPRPLHIEKDLTSRPRTHTKTPNKCEE